MPLAFHPRPGSILLCDYTTGFIVPEMVKRRPVVVVSPRLRQRSGLCSVAPLSATPPHPVRRYHCELILPPLPKPWRSNRCWVKADMLATVSFQRLDRIRIAKDRWGQRAYYDHTLSVEEIVRVRACVLHGLGMGDLIRHLRQPKSK